MLKKLLAFTCLTLSISANAAVQLHDYTHTYLNGSYLYIEFSDHIYEESTTIYDPADSLLIESGVLFINAETPTTLYLDKELSSIGDGGATWIQIGVGGVDNTVASVTDFNITINTYYTARGTRLNFGALGTTYSDGTQNVLNYSVVNAVPIPAAAWLFGSALLGLGAIKRKRS